MKKKDVSKNEDDLLNGLKEIQYTTNKDGSYTTVKSDGWEPKNNALKQAINFVDEQIEDARQDVLSGKKSPIYFYMHLKQMDLNILKQYTGFSKFKIKKHLNFKKFIKLNQDVLKIYADSFNISINELKSVPENPVDSLDYNFNFKIKNKQLD